MAYRKCSKTPPYNASLQYDEAVLVQHLNLYRPPEELGLEFWQGWFEIY